MKQALVSFVLLSFVIRHQLVNGTIVSCPLLTEPCMTDENYAICQRFQADENCVEVMSIESCPIEFRCIEKSNEIVERKRLREQQQLLQQDHHGQSNVNDRSLLVYECPKAGALCNCPGGGRKKCVDITGNAKCKALVDKGCKTLGYRGCPFAYYCKKF